MADATDNIQLTKSSLPAGGCLFYFEILEPGQTFAKQENKLSFPAYITSLSDSHNPSWAPYNDMGRAAAKVMLESYSRAIDINFRVVALQRDNDAEHSAFTIFRKLDVLSRAVTPAYISGKGFVGRLIRFSIAKLWVGEYGYITSLSITPVMDAPWTTDEEGSGERPYICDVSLNIGFIGDKRPDSMNDAQYNYSNLPGSQFRIQDLQ